MKNGKSMRLLPLVVFAVWQAASGLGYSQVQEARVWIEGMT